MAMYPNKSYNGLKIDQFPLQSAPIKQVYFFSLKKALCLTTYCFELIFYCEN